MLVLEEGMPSFIEQELKALAYEHGLTTRIHGKDVVAAQGEYVPEVVLAALARFLGGDAERRRQALTEHVGQGRALLRAPLPKRPPAFCTGCPERPVFSALKIAQRELGETHVAADIGCHAFATLPPFNQGNTILGYGMSAGLRERGGAQLRQARDLDPGRRRLLALGPHRGGGQRGLQQAGLDRGGAGELLHLGHRPAGQSLLGQEPARRRR